MRFLVDECAGPAVAEWLRGLGHEVFSVYDEAQGISDDEILDRAVVENRILITNDKDFGRWSFASVGNIGASFSYGSMMSAPRLRSMCCANCSKATRKNYMITL